MAAKAGRIVIDLVAGVAGFTSDVRGAGGELTKFAQQTDWLRTVLNLAGKEADKTGQSLHNLGAHGVTGVQATSAALRVLEGNMQNNLRAAERFLANTLGLGEALQTIFPIVGATALLGVVSELGKKAYEAYEAFRNMEQAPARIASAFHEINVPLQKSNDELALANDKLRNEIALLEGKPRNALAEALDEARVAADNLAEALDKDLKALQKVVEEQQTPWYAKALGYAGTGDIEKEFGGKDIPGTFRQQIQDITDRAEKELSKLQPGKTQTERKAVYDQAEHIRAAERNELTEAYSKELDKVNQQLQRMHQLEAQRKAPAQPLPNVPTNADGLPVGPGAFGNRLSKLPQAGISDYQQYAIPNLEKIQRNLREQRNRLALQYENEDLTNTKNQKQADNDAANLTRPYRDKLNELSAQLSGLKTQLASIGGTETAQTLAKAWTQAQEAITKLNDEAAKRHQPALDQEQQNTLVDLFGKVGLLKSEDEFQTKLQKGNQSIAERVDALHRLTAAIGEGYDAQERAAIENEVDKFLGPNVNDKKFRADHDKEIKAYREQVASERQAQQTNVSATGLDKLNDQIELENSLASAQRQGAAAAQLVTFAYKLREEAINQGLDKTRALIDAEIRLAQIQNRPINLNRLQQQVSTTTESAGTPEEQQRKQKAVQSLGAEIQATQGKEKDQAAASLADIQRQIEATNNLTAAQVGGADKVREAQLNNRIAEIEATVPPGEDRQKLIAAARQQSAAQEQLQVAQQAEGVARSYQAQLDSIDKQISYLQQKKALGQDVANDEIGIQRLEEQRTKVYAQQVAVLGSARDGMRAFFQEMATEGVSAAETVHDSLKKTFDSLNDSLAKLVSGQKVSWSSFVEGISSQLTKMSLQNLEAHLASKLFPQQQNPSGQQAVIETIGPLAALGSQLPTPPPYRESGEHTPHGFLGHIEHAFSSLIRPAVGQHQQLAGMSPADQATTNPASRFSLGSRDGQSTASALFVTTVDAGSSANPAPSAAALPPPAAASAPPAPNIPVAPTAAPTANPLAALGETLPTAPPFRQSSVNATNATGKLSLPEAISRVEGFNANPQNIPTRLNNPGDLKYGPFAQKYGASADQSGFAKFPSAEVGKQAEVDLLKSPGYANLPLSQAITRYNGTNQPNNPAYLRAIEKFTGLSPDTLVRDALKLLPGFADGGRPDPNKISIIGERGPELFIPDGLRGTVLPNHHPLTNAFTDAPIPVHPNTHGIHVKGQMPDAVAPPAPSLASKFGQGFTDTWDMTSGPPMVKRYLLDIPAEERNKAVDAWQNGRYFESIGHVFASIPGVPGFASDLVSAQMQLGQRAGQEFSQGEYEKAVVHELAATVPLLGPNSVAISDLLESGNPNSIAQGLGQLAGFAAAGLLPLGGLSKAAELAKANPHVAASLTAVRQHPATRALLGDTNQLDLVPRVKSAFRDFMRDPVADAYLDAEKREPDAVSPFSGAPIYRFPGHRGGTRTTGFRDRVTGRIFISENESPEAQFATFIHESAHEALYPHLRQVTQGLPIPKALETQVRRGLMEKSFNRYRDAQPWEVYNEGFAYGTETGIVPGLDQAQSQRFIETILSEADRKGRPQLREQYNTLRSARLGESRFANIGIPGFSDLRPKSPIPSETFPDLFHLPKSVADIVPKPLRSPVIPGLGNLSGDSIAAAFGALLPQLPFPDLTPLLAKRSAPSAVPDLNQIVQGPLPQAPPFPQAFPLAQFGGFRALGGPVRSDKVHVVGEQGPELFVPETDGTIIPHHKLASLSAMTGGSTQKGMLAALGHDTQHATQLDAYHDRHQDATFGGFRQDGGDVEGGKLHIVGEKGMELFIPIDSLNTINPENLTQIGKTVGPNLLPQVLRGVAGVNEIKPDAVTPDKAPDSSKALNSLADANALQNAMRAMQGNPKAFDNTKQTEQFSNVSLPVKTQSFGEVLFDAAASGLQKGLGGGRSGGLGGAIASGIGHLFNRNSSSTNSLDISAGNSPDPFGGNPPWQTLPQAPGLKNMLGSRALGDLSTVGIGIGIGLLKHFLFDQNPNHHFKPGSPYYIPNFNASLASGGEAKAHMTHLVGEQGPELFVPSRLSKLSAYSTDGKMQLPAAVGARETMPFGGYRATGGTVDPSQSFLVGEAGPEMFVPPTSGNIVPNHALGGNAPTNLYVDARGTDPAQSAQNFQRALQKTSQHSVKTSFRATHEFQMRSPQQSGSNPGWS